MITANASRSRDKILSFRYNSKAMNTILNKKATFDYEILEKFEAGLILTGAEVKSIRAGQMKLPGSYITVKHETKPTLFLTNANISRYAKASPLLPYDPLRSRQLLLTKKEIDYLAQKTMVGGLTLIPLRVYTKSNLIKLEFALASGKKKHDKRESIKKRDLDRRMREEMKRRTP
jgi:SsrA-binding protein